MPRACMEAPTIVCNEPTIVGNLSYAYYSLTARPPFEYVKGGGGIFCDMAIHDLDMARLLLTMALLTMWPYLPWPYLL